MNERDIEHAPEDPRLAAIYREAASEEPPSHLDAAVLRNARSAAAARRPEPRTPWWMRWRVPFAFAAVAVMSVSIALIVGDEGGAPMRLDEAPSARIAPPPAPVPAPAETAPDASRAAAGGAAPRADTAAATAEPQKRGDTSESIDRLQALAKRRAEETERSRAQEEKTEARMKALRDGSPAEGAAVAGKAASAPQAEAATVPGKAAASAAPAERESAILAAPPPPPAAQAPAATAQAPASAPAPMAAPAPAPKPLAAQRRAAPAADAIGPSIASIVAELDKSPPADWIAQIASLRKEGRGAEADALRAEFRRRFPDEPLPPGER